MSFEYIYNKKCNLDTLTKEIARSTITVALDYLQSENDELRAYFKAELTIDEHSTLDGIIQNHIYTDNTPIIAPLDTDNAPIVRPKAAKAGWTFSLIPIEITTSKVAGIDYCKSFDGNDRTGISIKIYDDQDVQIVNSENEGNAVKTVIDFEPTYDYEIIGGSVQQNTKPVTNIRIWTVAVPDIPAQNGGSKEMVGGINLKFIDPTDKIEADGRVSKYLTYNDTYHTNKLRFIIKHDAGIQHNLLINLQLFKA